MSNSKVVQFPTMGSLALQAPQEEFIDLSDIGVTENHQEKTPTKQKQPPSSLYQSLSGKQQGKVKMSMEDAKNMLIRNKIPFKHLGEHHLKFDNINFYPSSGTITVDGVGKVLETGIYNFIKAIKIKMSQTE